MSFYEDNPDKLKEDIQLAREFGITLDEKKLAEFIEQLVTRRSNDVHKWHEYQIRLDTFD